jgi:hypothetical protein
MMLVHAHVLQRIELSLDLRLIKARYTRNHEAVPTMKMDDARLRVKLILLIKKEKDSGYSVDTFPACPGRDECDGD